MDFLEGLREETRGLLRFSFKHLELKEDRGKTDYLGVVAVYDSANLSWIYHRELATPLKGIVELVSLLEKCFEEIKTYSDSRRHDATVFSARDFDERGVPSVAKLHQQIGDLKILESRIKNPFTEFQLDAERLVTDAGILVISKFYRLGDPEIGVDRDRWSSNNHDEKKNGVQECLQHLEFLVSELIAATLNDDIRCIEKTANNLVLPFVRAYQLSRFCLEYLDPVCLDEAEELVVSPSRWRDLGFDFLVVLKQQSALLAKRLLRHLPE